MTHPENLPARATESAPARSGWVFAALVVAFLVLRVPVMFLQPGGEDEDCYGVPGMMILRTGLPQLPHIPARNLDSVFFHADRILYSEPPLYFYVQAVFYMLLPDVMGTPRLCSAVCGIVLLALVWRLGRVWLHSEFAAAWAVVLLSVSRWFYFPATRARPDILAGLFGILAVLMICRWREKHDSRWLAWAGVAIGLGGLTHPFALVYAVQIAVWVALESRGRQRVVNPALVAFVSLLVACLWLPLILLEPDIFMVQFKNQYLAAADGGLLTRLFSPWESLWYHTRFLWQFLQKWQLILVMVPLFLATVIGIVRRDRDLLTLSALSWSSIYLLAVLVGTHHPALGYWIYTAALLFLTVGWLIDAARPAFAKLTAGRPVALWIAAALLPATMLPGSGVRAFAAYVGHWGDVNYNSIAFSKMLMDKLPAEDAVTVDTQFALDFVAAGRKVTLAQTIPVYLRADTIPYDHLVISRYGLQTGIIGRMCVTPLQWTAGNKDDEFSCYAEVYGQAEFPCPPEKQTPLRPTGREF